jgi:hypothetical protein
VFSAITLLVTGWERVPNTIGRDWDPATDIVPVATESELRSLTLYTRGFTLPRESFPEADAVYDEKLFSLVGDLFASAGFFVVRGRLAKILSHFDLGSGGLVPFSIYQADLATPHNGEFFLLNFGARKNTIMIDKCEDATEFYIDKDSKQQVWEINQ